MNTIPRENKTEKSTRAAKVAPAPTSTTMTVAALIAKFPPAWMNAQVCIGDSIYTAEPVVRIALHDDLNGRRVVVLYSSHLKIHHPT